MLSAQPMDMDKNDREQSVIIEAIRGFENEGFIAFLRPLLKAISKMVNCIMQLIFCRKKIKRMRDGFLLKMNGPIESHDSGLKEASRVHFECKQFAVFKTCQNSCFLLVVTGCFVLTGLYLNKGQAQDKASPLHLAQYQDSADTYDPFADYSEFDSVTEEEADINFFKHGRMLSVGGLAGARMFTQQLYRETKPAFIGGLFVSFFFSLRFAIQANYLWGVHPLRIVDQTDQLTTYTSQMSLSQLGFDMKYYLNTQNVTQGLAIINPYFIIGADRLVQIIQIRDYREGRLEPRSIFGFHGGIGIEFPFTLNKAFIGIEVQYQYVQLPRRLYDLESNPKSLPNQGDILKGLAIIGINF